MNARLRRLPRICLLLLAAAPVWAQDEPAPPPDLPIQRSGDLVSIFAGDVHVPPGVVQDGDVVCLGGNATIEGHVRGDVVVILGQLELTGNVDGEVTGVMTRQTLRHAQVDGNLVTVMGSLHLEDSAVDGQLVNVFGTVDRDALTRIAESALNLGFGPWVRDLWTFVTWVRIAHKLLIFLLLVLLVSLVPHRVRAMADEAPVRYVAAFFMGILGYLGTLVVLGLLLVTVCGAPAALLAFAVLKWMGIAAIFLSLGRAIGRALGREMSMLGAVLLAFALYAIAFLLPAAVGFGVFQLVLLALLRLGFLLLFEIPAVGLVILTRVGTRTTPARSAAAVPVPPVAP